jgi:hypothetical protein
MYFFSFLFLFARFVFLLFGFLSRVPCCDPSVCDRLLLNKFSRLFAVEKRREEQNRTEERRGEIFGVALVSMYRHLEIAAGLVSCFRDSRKPRKIAVFLSSLLLCCLMMVMMMLFFVCVPWCWSK